MSVYATYDLMSSLRLVSGGNLISAPILSEIAVSSDLEDLSGVEEITLISLTEGISAQFRWNVYLASGYTRATELATGPFALGAVIAGNGSLRSSPYGTLANFLPACRFLVGYGNNSGALQETAVVSAKLLVKRIS